MTHSNDSQRPRRTRGQLTFTALVLLASVGWAQQASAVFAAASNMLDGNRGSADCQRPVDILVGPVVNPANNHRYYLLHNAPWPASEAQAICLGGHLVTINDDAEERWVWETFSRYGGVDRGLWIGFTDAAAEGTWMWSSGEPVTYTHWADGEPNDCAGEDYAIISPRGPVAGPAESFWNDVTASGDGGCGGHWGSDGVVELTDCGNHVLDAAEECDDGKTNPSDGCTNACTLCGNGVITPPEECDDGNLLSGDGCDANCTMTACGNGVRTGSEQCDDGNTRSCDGCSPTCRTEPHGYRCGDGTVSRKACGEECDDGNTSNDDACRTDCRLNVCGDGFRNPTTEECDDGNTYACDRCGPDCRIESGCGDGVLNPCWEACDDGNTSNTDACRNDCQFNNCGDGFRNPDTEQCDDGNGNDFDGCTTACTVCGDGVVTPPEQCDDGNRSSADACRNNCRPNVCGDGVLRPDTEVCDDGNRFSGDGCDANCTPTACGNGVVSRGEQCDDGNRTDGDGCDSNCTPTGCGNGVETTGEECDDGNGNPFDGCTNRCTICGNGIVTPPEECDDRDTNPSHGCTNACTRCGNGIVTPPESCDDGNLVGGDGCEDYCAQPGCGNAVLEDSEECDDGGICLGGARAGTPCTGAGTCVGGTCTTFGGDGCAANCTREREVTFDLVPGQVRGVDIVAGTSGAVLNADIFTIPMAFSGRQTLTIGEERAGQIPVVVKAGSVQLARVPVGTVGCLCPRAVAAKTCGGTKFEPDGVTPSIDCTPGYTAGDRVCAGKQPCAFVHGPGNSASGVIGCEGLDGVNVSLTLDAGGSSGTPHAPLLTVSGAGAAGSSILLADIAIGGGVCQCGVCQGPPIGGRSALDVCKSPSRCTGQDADVYGADGEFCTHDDPPDQRGTPVTALMTTGTATGQVLEGNHIGPFSVTGAPFRCGGLDTSGAALASTFTELARPPLGDILYASVLVASGDAGPCVGDCNATGTVTVDDVITLVNVALGRVQPSACANGIPPGGEVNVAVVIQAVNNALNGCSG